MPLRRSQRSKRYVLLEVRIFRDILCFSFLRLDLTGSKLTGSRPPRTPMLLIPQLKRDSHDELGMTFVVS